MRWYYCHDRLGRIVVIAMAIDTVCRGNVHFLCLLVCSIRLVFDVTVATGFYSADQNLARMPSKGWIFIVGSFIAAQIHVVALLAVDIHVRTMLESRILQPLGLNAAVHDYFLCVRFAIGRKLMALVATIGEKKGILRFRWVGL
jgi:hypothetical protein